MGRGAARACGLPFDIEAFVTAVTDPAGYAARWPDCDILRADVNRDGSANTGDIDVFAATLKYAD